MQEPVKHSKLCLGNQTFTRLPSILSECSQHFVLNSEIFAKEFI